MKEEKTYEKIFINLKRFQSDCKARNFNISFVGIITIYFLHIFLLFRVNELEACKRAWDNCATMCECKLLIMQLFVNNSQLLAYFSSVLS